MHASLRFEFRNVHREQGQLWSGFSVWNCLLVVLCTFDPPQARHSVSTEVLISVHLIQVHELGHVDELLEPSDEDIDELDVDRC